MRTKKITYQKQNEKYVVKKRKLKIKNWFIIFIIPSLFLIYIAVMLISSSSKVLILKTLSYSEKGNSSYKVSLKPNDYYSESVLGPNLQYIANLIDTVDTTFNYEFHSTEKVDIEYSYKIIGEIKVTDKTDLNKILFKKEEDLTELKKVNENNNNFVINESLKIDYDKYNQYVNEFRREFSLSSNSVLIVKLVVETNAQDKAITENINNKNELSITIPLMEQTINITNGKSINGNGSLSSDEVINTNYIILFLGILSLLCGATVLVIGIYTLYKVIDDDVYRKALNRLLKEYDGYIITAHSSFVEKEEDLIRVQKFEELLDAQRMEDKPIIFYEVEPNNKAYFIVNGDKNIYRFTLTRYYQEKYYQRGKY